MAKLEHYHTKFDYEGFYHIYNRTIDKQPLFKNEGNFEFFLKKYDHYISPVAKTFAFCLLGNHFHFLIQVRSKEDLTKYQKILNGNEVDMDFFEKPIHDIVSHQFRKFFQSYALAFNKQQDRTGTLFQTPFKRVLINNNVYFTKLIYYIHANPQYHGLIDDFREWKWSSYDRIILPKSSKLQKETVIDWFGSVDDYKDYHSSHQKMLNDDRLIMEDE